MLEQDTVVESEPKEGEGPILDVGKSLALVAERLNGGANRRKVAIAASRSARGGTRRHDLPEVR